LVVNYTAILGGIQVDLSATDVLTTIDGGTNAAVQTGFENVDLSSFSGFGSVVTGSTADNTIVGTVLADSISGGAGADTITGGAGADSLTGGAGADTFVLTDRTAIDDITDFISATDLVSLNGGAVATVGGTEVGIVAATTLVFDTIGNLGTLGATIGNDVTGNGGAGVNYAVASDTGAIFFDADGDWTAGSVQIGTVGAVAFAATDFVI
jgi:Ca2+-binding RTX toxin-like protein